MRNLLRFPGVATKADHLTFFAASSISMALVISFISNVTRGWCTSLPVWNFARIALASSLRSFAMSHLGDSGSFHH
jgi:hypothetical protein